MGALPVDSIVKIRPASILGTSVDAILSETPGLEPSKLRVGQKIRLPAGR